MNSVSSSPEIDTSEPQHQDKLAESPEGWDFSSWNTLTREGPIQLKVLKLAVRGTPAQIASVIENLSNKVAETEGYLPFYFGHLGFLHIPIKSDFAVDTHKIDDIIVRSTDFRQAILEDQPLTVGTKSVGRMTILSRPRDKGGDTSCLEFMCHEPDCEAFKERLDQLIAEMESCGYVRLAAEGVFAADGCKDAAPDAMAGPDHSKQIASLETSTAVTPEFDLDDLDAMHEELLAQRGRKSTPLKYRVAVVLGSLEADRRGMNQKSYCNFIISPRDGSRSLAVSTLRGWKKDEDILKEIAKYKARMATDRFQMECRRIYLKFTGQGR